MRIHSKLLVLVLSVTLPCLPSCSGQSRTQASANIKEETKERPVRTAPAGPLQSYADLVQRVAPAVVTVRSERRVRARQNMPLMFPFGDPFGDGDEPLQRSPRAPGSIQRGLGSGVIISADGRCLTNHHVVEGAQDIEVELTDGRQFKAKLMGSDPLSDLALLKIDATGLPLLALGDSDAVKVGDVVLAVGNPLGVGQTVTSGIISGKNRTTPTGDGSFQDFLQTDAAINRGNSGGALVNTAGELIGINSQILSTSGGSIGIGFAIPSNMARNVAGQLAGSGKVRRGQLGAGIQPLTPDLTAALGISERQGVLINSITPGSAAERAGLKPGDVVVALNGQAVSDVNTLRNQVAAAGPGSEVTVTYVRDKRRQDARIKLGELQLANAAEGDGSEAPERSGGARLGVTVQPVTPEIAGQLKLASNQGVLVRQVNPGSAAEDAGLAPGDVILELNRKPIRTVADVESALGAVKTGPVLLLVNREGQTVFLTVRLR